MITINREIHPVGQGAFYTESFRFPDDKRFNLVYDCGTYWDGSRRSMNYPYERNGESFKELLDTYLQSVDNKIDYIFVSHFHADHINGIRYLINHADNPNDIKIVMPWMSMNLRIFLYITDKIESVENEGNEFLYDLLGDSEGIFRIIEVSDEEVESVYGREVIVNGSKIGLPYDFWEYVPMSYIYPSLNQFADEFVERINERIFLHDSGISLEKHKLDILIKSYWKDIIDIHNTLKEKYKSVKENNMSLMLYSGSRLPYCVCRNIFNGLTPCWSSSIFIEAIKRDGNGRQHLSGCIYVGDMERKEAFEELQKISNRFGNIGIIQLSHHGDENEMNDKLMELNAPYDFCCFGSKNSYHHPGWKTISQCLENGIMVYPISEISQSFKQQILFF